MDSDEYFSDEDIVTNNLIHMQRAIYRIQSLINETQKELNDYSQRLEDEQKNSNIQFNFKQKKTKKKSLK